MSLVPTSKGTTPSQEWSVIQPTKPKRYDDSKNNAVIKILGGVATDKFREFWEERYPGRDPPEDLDNSVVFRDTPDATEPRYPSRSDRIATILLRIYPKTTGPLQ
jgi:hypothetical protein